MSATFIFEEALDVPRMLGRNLNVVEISLTSTLFQADLTVGHHLDSRYVTSLTF
jgi:hypothetical protein